MATIPLEVQSEFIRAATWHGDLKTADQMLIDYPDLISASIHTAAVCGNREAISIFVSQNSDVVHQTADPFGGTALVYLCLSKYLRLKKDREKEFIDAATILLDAGADANSGFWTKPPHPEHETALYGAAGVAHNEALTRLLLSRGADPNDGEVVYHSPEEYELGAMKAVIETGKLDAGSLALMLVRKHDWHDYYGVKYLLERGVNPNIPWGKDAYPLHHALSRDNHIAIITLLFDHGADPGVVRDGISGVVRAAREGRADVLQLMIERGFSIDLSGSDELIAACALGDEVKVSTIVKEQPKLADTVIYMGGILLGRFSGTGNAAGVQQLLNLGVSADAPFFHGDGYWGIPHNSLSIHIAAWRGRANVVEILIKNGSPVNLPDANGQTPLMLAVKACVDSYWSDRRSTDAARFLLEAGADASSIRLPTGYNEMDELIKSFL